LIGQKQILIALAELSTGTFCGVGKPSNADVGLGPIREKVKTHFASIKVDDANLWLRFSDKVYSAAQTVNIQSSNFDMGFLKI
jgi:hypothetical protein